MLTEKQVVANDDIGRRLHSRLTLYLSEFLSFLFRSDVESIPASVRELVSPCIIYPFRQCTVEYFRDQLEDERSLA